MSVFLRYFVGDFYYRENCSDGFNYLECVSRSGIARGEWRGEGPGRVFVGEWSRNGF
jgi:hypothetical protein